VNRKRAIRIATSIIGIDKVDDDPLAFWCLVELLSGREL
jgi:hypothetical protein